MTEDERMEIAEANVLAQIANGGKSCHWCMDKVRIAAAREAIGCMKAAYPKSGCYQILETHFGIKEGE